MRKKLFWYPIMLAAVMGLTATGGWAISFGRPPIPSATPNLAQKTSLTFTMNFDEMNCNGRVEKVGLRSFGITYWDGKKWEVRNGYHATSARWTYWENGALKKAKLYISTYKYRSDGSKVPKRCVGETTKNYPSPLVGLNNTDTINQNEITGWGIASYQG